MILAIGVGCSSSEPIDPLDPELVGELAVAQGSATGDRRSGTFVVSFVADECDCPTLVIADETVDLCATAEFGDVVAELAEGSGALGVTVGTVLLSGAIEQDGSFVVAGTQDISTVAGPLEALRRMDGTFSDDDRAEGWAGQRLLGELADQSIDCRWTGSFVMNRN